MKKNIKDLNCIKQEVQSYHGDWIKVGMSTCGIAAGAEQVYQMLMEERDKRNLDIKIQKCGCAGMCYAEPLVEVKIQGAPHVVYGKVDVAAAVKIIDKHAVGKLLLNDHVFEVKGNSHGEF